MGRKENTTILVCSQLVITPYEDECAEELKAFFVYEIGKKTDISHSLNT